MMFRFRFSSNMKFFILPLLLLSLSFLVDATARSISLPEGVQIEGITHARANLYFVADIRRGGVYLLDFNTRLVVTVVPSSQRISIGISTKPSQLFVAGGGQILNSTSALYVYDIATGRLETSCTDLPKGSLVNDVTTDANFAYYTDSSLGQIYQMRLSALPKCHITIIPLPRQKFRRAPFVFTANGIVTFASGLLVSNTDSASLFYVDLANGNRVQQVLQNGTIPGADGMAIMSRRYGNAKLFITQNSQNLVSVWNMRKTTRGIIAQFQYNITSSEFDTPTTVAFDPETPDFLAVANSRFGSLPPNLPLPEAESTFATRLRWRKVAKWKRWFYYGRRRSSHYEDW